MPRTFFVGFYEDINCHCRDCNITRKFRTHKSKELWERLHHKQCHPDSISINNVSYEEVNLYNKK